MDDEMVNPAPFMNDWANTSRWIGIIALLPYITSIIVWHLERKMNAHFFQVEFLIILCLLWGIVIGLASVITGVVGAIQIKNSQGTETGIFSTILGIMFGIVGIVANVLFDFLLYAALMPD